MLTTHTYNHPDVPTPQSIRSQFQLLTCQLGLQQNIPWWWEPGLLGNIGLLYDPKTASFFSHRWNKGTNPDLAFTSFGKDNRLPDSRFLEKFPQSQHQPSLITSPRLKVPAHKKRWNFHKLDWKCFYLLTGESVERLQPPDTTPKMSILRILREPAIWT